MNYTLHQLLIFLKVSELQSITKAAEELHLTQPAVSIQLRNLQDQFDIPLIESVGRNIYVTDFGKEVAESGRKIMEEVNQLRNKTLAYQGHLSGRIRISVVSTAKYVMPYFLNDFLDRNPGIELKMDVTNKRSVIETLEQNTVDFSMVSVLPDKLQVDKIELMPNRLVLVGRTDSPLGKRINLQTMDKLSLIFREKGSATRQAMEMFIKKNGIKAEKTLFLTSNEAVKQAVLAGLGYSIMPVIGLKNELIRGDLRIIEVKGLPIITNWYLIWRNGKEFSPAAKAYLEDLRLNKESIIASQFGWQNELEQLTLSNEQATER